MLRLGVTTRRMRTTHEQRDGLATDWGRFLQHVLPDIPWIPLPNTEQAVLAVVKHFEINALVLSGGDDWGIFPERDYTETLLLDFAKTHALPVLGVCRGAQVINRFCGGCLEAVAPARHVTTRHSVQLATEKISVNSFHQFGIQPKGLGKNLSVVGMDEQGYIEAFAHNDLPWKGILWHPEREKIPAKHDRKLVRELFLT